MRELRIFSDEAGKMNRDVVEAGDGLNLVFGDNGEIFAANATYQQLGDRVHDQVHDAVLLRGAEELQPDLQHRDGPRRGPDAAGQRNPGAAGCGAPAGAARESAG